MIDLVLKDSGIPAVGDDRHGLRLFIEALDPDTHSARNDGRESGETEATFKKFDGFGTVDYQLRIDQNMKRNRPAFALGDVLRRELLKVLRLVFDDSQLQGESDLRRRQAYARSVAHRVRHGIDQVLNRAAQNLVVRKAAGRLPQNWFAGLQDFKFHMGR